MAHGSEMSGLVPRAKWDGKAPTVEAFSVEEGKSPGKPPRALVEPDRVAV